MTRLLRRFLFSSLLAVALVAPAGMVRALTVDEAYAAIPHQRTPFSTSASRLSPAQAAVLGRLFVLSDRATVLRVQGLQALRAGDAPRLRGVLADYRALLGEFPSVNPGSDLQPAARLVQGAVVQHQKFFESRLQAGLTGTRQDSAFTPDVHQASDKLKQAYGLLMAEFPNEPAVNRQAFFDHLCALDFL